MREYEVTIKMRLRAPNNDFDAFDIVESLAYNIEGMDPEDPDEYTIDKVEFTIESKDIISYLENELKLNLNEYQKKIIGGFNGQRGFMYR